MGLSDEQPKSGYILNLRKRPGDIIIEQPENEVNIIDLHNEGSENVNQKQQEIQQEIPPKNKRWRLQKLNRFCKSLQRSELLKYKSVT